MKQTREIHTQKWKELRKNAEDEAKTVGENLKEQRNKKLTQRKRKCEHLEEEQDLRPQPKKSFVEALTGLMEEYTNKKQQQQKKRGRPPRRRKKFFKQRKGTSKWTKLCQKDMAPKQTLKKRRACRMNRNKLNQSLCMLYPHTLSIYECTNTSSCNQTDQNHNTPTDNQELASYPNQTNSD